jgi:hypothetical protein
MKSGIPIPMMDPSRLPPAYVMFLKAEKLRAESQIANGKAN